MPLIKNITAISYSSQDPKYPLNALLRGTGAWLCSPDDRSGRLSADLQLDRAITISYIDVGNHNSVTLSVEVSRSCSSNGATCALLPTVALMTPQEFRGQHPNCKAVRMFKAEDLDKRALKEQWDRVRVTCCQPFKRGVQFGLSFLKLYTSEVLQPLHPPSAFVPHPFPGLLPDAAGVSASVAASAPYPQVDSDLCTPQNHESMKKTSRGKSMLSDENILQRLENSSTSTFSSNTMMSGFVHGKTTNPQPFSSNVKDKQNKTMTQVSTPHAAQMKENNAGEAGKTFKNTSSHQSAAQRFRSALDKLCSNQASASPTAVARQTFLKKFGSSTLGSSPSEGGDGRPTTKPTSRTEHIDVPTGGGAAADTHQTEFEYESLEFLISLNLQKDQILQLKVADVRVQFEAQRGESLSRPQRLCFKNLALDYCARRLDTLDFGNQTGPSAVSRSLPAVESAAADVSSGRRNGCGISDTSGAGRLGGSSSSLATSIDGLKPKEPNKSKNAPLSENQGKFTFKKLEFESPSPSNHHSPVSGTKQPRFNRAVSKSPMPFYDDVDYPGTCAVTEKSQSSATRNISKVSAGGGGGSGKKRKKEESKPVADGEWVQSKKVRTRVSSSPRNIARKEAYVADIVEIVELDDLDEHQNVNKLPTNSPFQNNGGWLKTPKHKNTAREINREKSKSIFPGDTCNGDDTHQPRHSPAHKERATTTSGSSPCSTDTDSCERGPSYGSAAVSPDVHGQCVRDDGGPQTGIRLGAVPENKFGLRAPILPQREEENVECPICSRLFPSSRIEEHAATCDPSDTSRATEAPAAVSSNADISTADHEVCPVCGEQLSETDYAQHVLHCADRHF